MPKSTLPLIKYGNKTITAAAGAVPTAYETLLEFECDPDVVMYIRDIIIEVNSSATFPQFTLDIDGQHYLKDAWLYNLVGGLSFGGDLKLVNSKKPFRIQIRINVAGTLLVNAWVTGIIVPVNQQRSEE